MGCGEGTGSENNAEFHMETANEVDRKACFHSNCCQITLARYCFHCTHLWPDLFSCLHAFIQMGWRVLALVLLLECYRSGHLRSFSSMAIILVLIWLWWLMGIMKLCTVHLTLYIFTIKKHKILFCKQKEDWNLYKCLVLEIFWWYWSCLGLECSLGIVLVLDLENFILFQDWSKRDLLILYEH